MEIQKEKQTKWGKKEMKAVSAEKFPNHKQMIFSFSDPHIGLKANTETKTKMKKKYWKSPEKKMCVCVCVCVKLGKWLHFSWKKKIRWKTNIKHLESAEKNEEEQGEEEEEGEQFTYLISKHTIVKIKERLGSNISQADRNNWAPLRGT